MCAVCAKHDVTVVLDVYMHVHISPAEKTDSVLLKMQYLNILNSTNVLYVFNPFLLTSVFIAGICWFNSTIVFSKNDFSITFVSFVYFILHAVQNSSTAERCVWVAPSTVQMWIYSSFSLRLIHFTSGVKGLLHLPKIWLFILKKPTSKTCPDEKKMCINYFP